MGDIIPKEEKYAEIEGVRNKNMQK